MSIAERLQAPISRPACAGITTGPSDKERMVESRCPRPAASSFFPTMQLLPYRRREAMYALYDFCREVDDIADGDAPRSLKQTLLSDGAANWRYFMPDGRDMPWPVGWAKPSTSMV